ncbi:MAG: hypothetical protein ACREKE_01105 [bacterium]
MKNGTDDRDGFRPDSRRSALAALRFGGGRVAVAGIVAGLGIALGVPTILLSLGQNLGQVVLTVLVVLALAGGALVCVVSAFFGLVIPRHMHGGPWMDPDRWRRFALEMQRHRGEHQPFRNRSWGREDAREPYDDAEPAPARARRRRS